MSHYPPPPSFGGPFTPNAHFPPSPSAAYPLMPHLPYYQTRDTNNQSQGQSTGLATTHYVNSYAFNANQTSSRSGLPQTSYPSYGQTVNGALPPPPFPPIPPLSFAALSQTHPMLHLHEGSTASIQFQANLPVKPPSVSSVRTDAAPENLQLPTSTISELEDGELSDGEQHSRSKCSTSGNPKDLQVSITRHEGISSRDSSNDGRKIFQASNNTGSGESRSPYKPLPEYSQNGHRYPSKQTMANKHESSRMQESTHTKSTLSLVDIGSSNTMQRFSASQHSWSTEVPNGTHIPSLEATGSVQFKPTPTTQNQPVDNEARQENVLLGNPSLQTAAESANNIRERAKDVLRELYPHEIGFTKLLDEGIDPKILYELYAEIGIRIRSSSPTVQKVHGINLSNGGKLDDTTKTTYFQRVVTNSSQGQDQSNGQVDSSDFSRNRLQASQESQVAELSFKPLNAKDISNRQPSTSKSGGDLGDKANYENSNSKVSVTSTARSLDPASKPGTTFKAPKAPTMSLLSKSTNNKPGDKALERKDYIARMLAAKAGKPIPAAGTVSTVDTLVEHSQGSTLESSASHETEATGPIEERRLFVGNLSSATTELDLRDFFSGFIIKRISIPKKPPSGLSVSHGFVELTSPSEALRAISVLSKKSILNHQVSVQLVHTMENTMQDNKTNEAIAVQPQTEINSSSISLDGVASKKRAQTELARQRIEALKSRDSNQFGDQKHDRVTTSIQSQQLSPGQSQSITLQTGEVTPEFAHVSQNIAQSSNPAYSSSKPQFSIPGLFMAAATKDLVIPSLPSAFQASATSNETKSKHSSGLLRTDSVSYVESNPPKLTQSKIAIETSTLPTNSVVNVQSIANKAGASEPKKRQKAADFIDSPSIRIKRTLGQNEDTSVIIEISEDEDEQELEEEEVDMDVDMETDGDEEMEQGTPLKESSGHNHESGKPKDIRGLPPLSDFPSRKKMAPSIAIMTPPAAQTPTKSKEPKDLKLKEKEIELMNRKIAELEQRIKAKQTASRAQTPEKPGLAGTLSKELGVPATIQESLKLGVSVIDSSQEASRETEPQILRAGGEAPKNTPEIEVVSDIESVPKAEVTQKARVTQEVRAASEAKAAQEAKVAKAAQEARAADEAKAAQEAKVAKATQEAGLAERAEIAQAAQVAERERLLVEQRAKDLEQEKIDAEHSRSAEATKIAEEEQRRLRRNEIEFGLPLLDAEVERTKQKLQILKSQIEDLESEVQKGVEGRRVLMEELIGLAPSPTSLIVNEQVHENKRDIQVVKANEGPHRFPTPGPLFDSIQSQSKASTQGAGHGKPNSSSSTFISPKLTAQSSGNELSINQQQGNNMDINTFCASTDDGEVTDFSPDHPTNFSKAESSIDKESIHEQSVVVGPIPNEKMSQVNEDDVYEPPSIVDAKQSSTDQTTETRYPEADMSDTTHNTPLSNASNPLMLHGLSSIRNSSEFVDTQDEGSGSNRNLPLADASDSDDYEPPEPISPVENTVLQSSGKTTPQELYLPSPSSNVKNNLKNDMLDVPLHAQSVKSDNVVAIIGLEQQNDAQNLLSSNKGQFIPYESPLKQFRSYRFRPEYLSEVSRGFRSLTYNHGINSDKPLCRYELAGGVCNDDSCEGQHTRSLGLSDNMILVQMGAIPKGLNQEEGDAYAAGLRQIIQEIRGRKVTDFNNVASEIAAYRAKFLSEATKALPL